MKGWIYMLQTVINYFTANNYAELIGTISNILLIVAYSMRGEKRIRMMSVVGSSFSVAYNYIMHSTCFFILSFIIITINLYHLIFLKPE